MTTTNDMIFLKRKGVITKFFHPFQSIRVNRFVAHMKRHVHLRRKDLLKITNLARFINPRGRDGRMSRCNGERIWIAGYFLQRGYNQNLVFRVSRQSIAKSTRDCGNGAAQRGAENFGRWSRRVTAENRDCLVRGIFGVGRFLEELPERVDLSET